MMFIESWKIIGTYELLWIMFNFSSFISRYINLLKGYFSLKPHNLGQMHTSNDLQLIICNLLFPENCGLWMLNKNGY